MKKLLVAAIGAATAFGAFAEYTNAQRFEGMELGETSVSALGSNWSEKPNSTNTYTIVEMATVGETINHPDAFANETDPENALSVKTTFGKPLSFNVVSGGTATNLESNLYFDSLVKFTVCDSTPDQTYDGAKIIMWLQENEAQTATNLYVRAGYLGDGIVTTNDYICGNTIGGDFADKWHRVTIKAMPTISTDASIPGFAIFIDGGNNTMEVSSDDPKWAVAPALTEAAAHYGQTKIFPSIIQDSTNPAKLTLTCASFDGTGTLNDMVFTSKTPSFTEAEDYVAPKASIQIGDDVEEYPTLNAAIAALNAVVSAGSTKTVTFALLKGIGLTEALTAIDNTDEDVEVIIDLNGCGITNSVGSTLSINSPVTIIDSSVAKTGEIVMTGTGDDDYAIELGDSGTLELTAGTVVGYMTAAEGEGAIIVSGGTINQDSGYTLAEGKKAVASSRGEGFYDVVDFVPVAQIEGGAQYETLKDAVDAATAGQTVTVLANCEVTEPITFTKGITVSNDYVVTVANAGNSITYAYRVINGTSTPVTLCGTGTFTESGTPSGSQFLVGFTMTRYETAATAGSLVLDGCTVTNGQSNVIKVENGTFTMNSGTIDAAALRAVKADGEDGANSATLTINGGTINSSTKAVAVSSKAGGGAASATINGGTIAGPVIDEAQAVALSSITIPGSSTAKFDADQTAFCATDYKMVLSDGWWVVTAMEYYTAISLNKATTSLVTNETETLTATLTPASAADDSVTWTTSDATVATVEGGVVTAVGAGTATITAATKNYSADCTVTVTAPSPTPVEPTIDPETNTPVPVEAGSAEAAKEAVKITPPATSGADAAAYKALFNLKAEPAGEGKFDVSIDSIKDSVEQSVAASAEKLVSGSDATGTINIPAGLYYKVTPSAGLPISGTPVKGLSDGTTTTITKPTGTQGFIKVEIGTAEYK